MTIKLTAEQIALLEFYKVVLKELRTQLTAKKLPAFEEKAAPVTLNYLIGRLEEQSSSEGSLINIIERLTAEQIAKEKIEDPVVQQDVRIQKFARVVNDDISVLQKHHLLDEKTKQCFNLIIDVIDLLAMVEKLPNPMGSQAFIIKKGAISLAYRNLEDKYRQLFDNNLLPLLKEVDLSCQRKLKEQKLRTEEQKLKEQKGLKEQKLKELETQLSSFESKYNWHEFEEFLQKLDASEEEKLAKFDPKNKMDEEFLITIQQFKGRLYEYAAKNLTVDDLKIALSAREEAISTWEQQRKEDEVSLFRVIKIKIDNARNFLQFLQDKGLPSRIVSQPYMLAYEKCSKHLEDSEMFESAKQDLLSIYWDLQLDKLKQKRAQEGECETRNYWYITENDLSEEDRKYFIRDLNELLREPGNKGQTKIDSKRRRSLTLNGINQGDQQRGWINSLKDKFGHHGVMAALTMFVTTKLSNYGILLSGDAFQVRFNRSADNKVNISVRGEFGNTKEYWEHQRIRDKEQTVLFDMSFDAVQGKAEVENFKLILATDNHNAWQFYKVPLPSLSIPIPSAGFATESDSEPEHNSPRSEISLDTNTPVSTPRGTPNSSPNSSRSASPARRQRADSDSSDSSENSNSGLSNSSTSSVSSYSDEVTSAVIDAMQVEVIEEYKIRLSELKDKKSKLNYQNDTNVLEFLQKLDALQADLETDAQTCGSFIAEIKAMKLDVYTGVYKQPQMHAKFILTSRRLDIPFAKQDDEFALIEKAKKQAVTVQTVTSCSAPGDDAFVEVVGEGTEPETETNSVEQQQKFIKRIGDTFKNRPVAEHDFAQYLFNSADKLSPNLRAIVEASYTATEDNVDAVNEESLQRLESKMSEYESKSTSVWELITSAAKAFFKKGFAGARDAYNDWKLAKEVRVAQGEFEVSQAVSTQAVSTKSDSEAQKIKVDALSVTVPSLQKTKAANTDTETKSDGFKPSDIYGLRR